MCSPFFFSLNPSLSATPDLVSVPRMDQVLQAAIEAQACAHISVDESQPVTSIQIRLADGGRLVQKFNHTHRYSIKNLLPQSLQPDLLAFTS